MPELTQGPAALASENLAERVCDVIGGSAVDEDDDALVRRRPLAFVVRHTGHSHTRHVAPVDDPPIDVPDEEASALRAIGFVVDPARTHGVAVACLEEVALELI